MDIICDIDGTIADLTHRRKWVAEKPKNWKKFFADMSLDQPILPVISVIADLYRVGNNIIFCSGRPDEWMFLTREWLEKQFGQVRALRGYIRLARQFTMPDAQRAEIGLDVARDFANLGVARDLDFSGFMFDRMEIEEYQCNWKTFIEVYLEDYHVDPFHPGLGGFVNVADLKWEFGDWYSVQTCGVKNGIAAYLPGRTERVNNPEAAVTGPSVYVDFGHSPDAFLNTLAAVRKVTTGKVIGPKPKDEVCDTFDNDCDGLIDEGFDADGDGIAEAVYYNGWRAGLDVIGPSHVQGAGIFGALDIAREVYPEKMPGDVVVIGIEAESIEKPRTGLTESVERAIPEAVEAILCEIRESTSHH
mgnify:CR=1 FL=1